ncbi:MAG: hypothetical protein GQ573_04035 [Gammaproteobacteria bacterium]|nr:hypothetical protein [Gammaproteobacteria bacterium]
MNRVSPPKTRRELIHGGSNPASMRDTVFGGDTQSMSLTILSDSSADQCSIGAIEFEIFVPIMVTTSLGLVCLP